MSGTEIMIAVRILKLIIDKAIEIKKENDEIKKILEALKRDLFVVELVCDEIEKSKVVVNPDLQKALTILFERVNEVKDAVETVTGQHEKWVHKIFGSKQMLKQTRDASTKLSDQIEVLPAAFEAQRFAQDRAIKDASSDLQIAIDFFVREEKSRSMWKDLRTLDPEFRNLYEKLAAAAPEYLEAKFDETGSSKSDCTLIAEALGVENGVTGKASLVKFAKWLEGKPNLNAAISATILKSMQAEFHRRRKRLLCPDLELLWIGPHLAELETRATIRQCFQEAPGQGLTFNITHAATVKDAEELLKVNTRLIGQIVSGRVIVITTSGMDGRLKKMLAKSRLNDAKAVQEPQPSQPVDAESKAPEADQQQKLKIVVYHNNFKSFSDHYIDSQFDYVLLGSTELKNMILNKGEKLVPTTQESRDKLIEDLEALADQTA
jgi:hypothetical protein